jgi:hypothetical protein
MDLRGDLRRSADRDRLATALFAALRGGLVLAQVGRGTGLLEAALDTMLEHLSSFPVPGAPLASTALPKQAAGRDQLGSTVQGAASMRLVAEKTHSSTNVH